MNIVDSLDSPKVVNSWVDTDFVETDQTGILELLLESLHLGVDVRGGYDVDLLLEGDLHDGGVVGVWNKGDNNVVTLHGLSESIVRRDIDRDRGSVGNLGAEGLSSGESPACDCELVVESGDVLGEWGSDETGSEKEDLLLAGLGSLGGSELGQSVDIVL